MRNEEKILESLAKTGAGCTKSISKNGDEISVCQIKTYGTKSPWGQVTSIEEIWTYRSGLIQSYERLTARKATNFIPEVKITHSYKPSSDNEYEIEDTITTEFSQSKTTRVETRFRGTGSRKKVNETNTNCMICKTFLGNENELLSMPETESIDELDKEYYDHVVFMSSSDMNTTINSVRVSTPSGVGEYSKSQMRIGPSSTFGVTRIKDTNEMSRWETRHPIYPELPAAKFYGNQVTIFDYEWRPTKYGNARFTRIRTFANDMDPIMKYAAIADVLKGEYDPLNEDECYPETLPRTPYGENINVKITEGEYTGSCFEFYIRAVSKKDTSAAIFYGIKPEDTTEGFIVIPFRQTIKLTMNGSTPNSKRVIELKTIDVSDRIGVQNRPFIVRTTENVNEAIARFISNYTMDTTSYVRAFETNKYVRDDGSIIIQEIEYETPDKEEPDIALLSV